MYMSMKTHQKQLYTLRFFYLDMVDKVFSMIKVKENPWKLMKKLKEKLSELWIFTGRLW